MHWTDFLWALVAAIVLGVAGWFGRRFLIAPWIIRERWRGKFTEGEKIHSEDVELSRLRINNTIWGTSTLRYTDEFEREETAQYEFHGTFKHNVMTAYFEGVGKDNPERGAFVIQYTLNNTFRGKYLVVDGDKVSDPVNYSWERR